MAAAIEIGAVSAGYGTGAVVRDVGADEIVALVGRSGTGKTTILRLAAWLIAPSTGPVRLRLPLEVNADARVNGHVSPSEWLARMRVADGATAYPHQLSGGMRQRVALARAQVTVDLPRPRSASLRRTPRFYDIVEEVRAHLA